MVSNKNSTLQCRAMHCMLRSAMVSCWNHTWC